MAGLMVLCVIGLPVLAMPQSCEQWDVSGDWMLIQSNVVGRGVRVKLRQSGSGISGSAQWTEWKEGTHILGVRVTGDDVEFHDGKVDGTLDGNRLSVQIYWKDRKVGVYTGEVAPSGRLNGTTYDRFHPNNRAEWYSEGLMKCSPSAIAPKKRIKALGKGTSKAETRPLNQNDVRGTALRSGNANAVRIDACKTGYVWREASSDDRVCVTPESRRRVALENRGAASRRDPNGDYGPSSCMQGFVWREAYAGDTVCVTPPIRAVVREENRVAGSRLVRNR